MKKFWLVNIILFQFLTVFAQKQTHSFHYNQADITQVLQDVEQQFKVRFSYETSLLQNKKITIDKANIDLKEFIKIVENQLNVKFIPIKNQYYVILPAEKILPKEVLQEVVINAYLTQGINKKKDGSFEINPEKLGILAGLTEPDVLESIQQLPGAVGLNETATNFNIRAGGSNQNAIYYDGMRIYQSGHLFGMIAPFNPNTIKKVKYFYKGVPAQYEGGVSSVIDLQTSDSIAHKMRFEAGINAVSTDAVLHLPVIPERLSIVVAGRSSYRSLWLSPGLKQYENKVFENTNLEQKNIQVQTFDFNDISLKINAKPYKNYLLNISYIHIKSKLNFDNSISALPDYQYKNALQTQTDGLSVKLSKPIDKKLHLYSKFDMTWYDLLYQNDILKLQNKIGDIKKENFVSHTGFEAGFSYHLNQRHLLNGGYAYNEKRTAYLFSLIVNDQTYVYDYLKNKNNTQAVFLQYRYRNSRLFDIDAGVRLPYIQEINKLYLEPRLVIGKQILPHIKWQLNAGILHQNIQQNNKTVIGLLNLENSIWQVSEPKDFPLLQSVQMGSGLIYSHRKWYMEMEAYYKHLKNISISVPYRIYDSYDYLTGEEKSMGIDVFIKKKFRYFDAWLSYGLQKANYRFEPLKDNKSFVSDLEIQHKLLTSVMYHYQNLQLAASWFWRTPRAYYRGIINDAQNSEATEINIKPDFEIAYLNPYNRLIFRLCMLINSEKVMLIN